jgi:hypothetical protein
MLVVDIIVLQTYEILTNLQIIIQRRRYPIISSNTEANNATAKNSATGASAEADEY